MAKNKKKGSGSHKAKAAGSAKDVKPVDSHKAEDSSLVHSNNLELPENKTEDNSIATQQEEVPQEVEEVARKEEIKDEIELQESEKTIEKEVIEETEEEVEFKESEKKLEKQGKIHLKTR